MEFPFFFFISFSNEKFRVKMHQLSFECFSGTKREAAAQHGDHQAGGSRRNGPGKSATRGCRRRRSFRVSEFYLYIQYVTSHLCAALQMQIYPFIPSVARYKVKPEARLSCIIHTHDVKFFSS